MARRNNISTTLFVWGQIVVCSLGFYFFLNSEKIGSDSSFPRWIFILFLFSALITVLFSFRGPRREKYLDLERNFQRKSEFLSSLSHELRTPLTSIQGYSELALKEIETEQLDSARNSIGVIQKNTNRLLDLVSDLMSLSRLEHPETVLERDWQSTQQLTTEVQEVLNQKRLQKAQEIHTENLETQVFCDRAKTLQVLINLVDNGLRYSPNLAQLRVRWFRDPNKKHRVFLDVEDSGPGIPHDQRDRIFEKFYRLDRSRTRDLGGTGLGLAIVKQIMKTHGGDCKLLISDLGGCLFRCEFPDPEYSTQ
jgi:two-component system phosphate regulon sensor histidine kinase PhoR